MRNFFFIGCMLWVGLAQAHIYQYRYPDASALNTKQTRIDEYIRIIEHPEMKGYFSYGLCKKKLIKSHVSLVNHTHEDCKMPPGQYWWSMHEIIEPSFMGISHDQRYLRSILDDDELGKERIFFVDTAVWLIGGWNGTAVATKIALTGFAKLVVSAAIAWGENSLFWKGAEDVSSYWNTETYDKTIPYTKNAIWSGEKDLTLDAIPQSQQTSNGKSATPPIENVWWTMLRYLIQADNHEYKRVLYDFGSSWWNENPKYEITYMSVEKINALVSSKDKHYRCECLIGSDCDAHFPIHSFPVYSEYQFNKISINQLQHQYAPSIVESLSGHHPQYEITIYDEYGKPVIQFNWQQEKLEQSAVETIAQTYLKKTLANPGVYFIEFHPKDVKEQSQTFKFAFFSD